MKGFTLTELLVAIIILLICVTGVFSLIAVGTDMHTRAVDSTNLAAVVRRVAAELQENLDRVKPKDVKNARVPGFPDSYRYDAHFAPMEPAADFSTCYIVTITLRGILPGETIHKVVLARKLAHKDVLLEPPAPDSGDTGPNTRRGYDPIVDFLRTAGSLPDIEFKPPDEEAMVKLFLGMLGTAPKIEKFEWTTVLSLKTDKGMVVFLKQPVLGGNTPAGKSFFSMNVSMSFFPSAAGGLTHPRAVQLVQRECSIAGVPTEVNSHPWRVDGPTSDVDVTYLNQKLLARGELKDVADRGVLVWDAPGIADPWKTQQNFDVRVAWHVMTWILCNTASGGVTPVGYFRWRVVLDGRVGLAPMDTRLDVRLDECTWIESDASDEKGDAVILKKFWK